MHLSDPELEQLAPLLADALEHDPEPNRRLISLASRVLAVCERRGYPRLAQRLRDAIGAPKP
jgi:hypothetical protein